MRALPVILLTLFLAGCSGPTVDLSQGLQVVDLASGWFDVGIVDGKNKLVPSVAFKLKNVSDQPLPVLQVDVRFHRAGDPTLWASVFRRVVGAEGLGPGATSDVVTIDSTLGYTGTEARADMLKNAQFVDAEVKVFAKYGSTQWKSIGEFPVTRQLLTR